jgi:hypothetical protein
MIVTDTRFEDPLWSHTKERRHHRASSISCLETQLDDMLQVTETDSDYYRKLHLGLWTALNGGDEVLKW